MRPTVIKLDLRALLHNAKVLKQRAPTAKLMAAVKANAYGHDARIVSKTLEHHVEQFAVASLEEAIALREAGVKAPILLLEGVFQACELEEVVKHDCSLVVHSSYQIDALKQFKSNKAISVWLKITTGMNRLGVRPESVKECYLALSSQKSVKDKLGLMSHFATADQPDSTLLQEQFKTFCHATKGMNSPRSIANSAGIFADARFHLDWVRSGLALYGVSPTEGVDEKALNLRPVMSFNSSLIAIQHCNKGETVGYGAQYRISRRMRVGVVAAGYGDGYPRHVNNGYVLVEGKKAAIVGRISMDMLSVDLSNVPQASIGSKVVLWGEGLSVREVAAFSGTISYDLLTRMTLRARKETLI